MYSFNSARVQPEPDVVQIMDPWSPKPLSIPASPYFLQPDDGPITFTKVSKKQNMNMQDNGNFLVSWGMLEILTRLVNYWAGEHQAR